MTSYPPSDPFSEFESRPEKALRGGEYPRENPLLLLLLGLLAGALLGAYLSRRKRKQRDAVQAAKEWLDAAYAQLAEKLPQLVEKLPQSKKPTQAWCQAAFLDQARQAGKKLKWW